MSTFPPKDTDDRADDSFFHKVPWGTTWRPHDYTVKFNQQDFNNLQKRVAELDRQKKEPTMDDKLRAAALALAALFDVKVVKVAVVDVSVWMRNAEGDIYRAFRESDDSYQDMDESYPMMLRIKLVRNISTGELPALITAGLFT